MKKTDKHFMVRIRYTDNYRGEGKEAYIFENKLANEEKWGTDTAYVLDENGLISWEALAKVRDMIKCDIDFWFC